MAVVLPCLLFCCGCCFCFVKALMLMRFVAVVVDDVVDATDD